MGLCKCPKKVVTTLFCYEHRVNVCESCLVSNHPSCIIQSYYKWLQDSEYDPKCSLCGEDLSLQDCVRLTCFHVFHLKCFGNVVDGHPKTTAPAGYKCPTCCSPIFPGPQSVSPVAQELRRKMHTLGWSEVGSDSDLKRNGECRKNDNIPHKLNLAEDPRLISKPPSENSVDFDSIFKKHRLSKLTPTLFTVEEDAGKYRRRRPLTLQQNLNYLRRSPYFKFVFMIIFTLFFLCILFVSVIPTEFEEEKAFKRIIALKERADKRFMEMEVSDQQ